MDPVLRTLREALEAAESAPTVLWGRGLGPLARSLGEEAPVRLVAPDVGTARGARVPVETALAPEPGEEQRFVARMPRSRQELAWRLAVAASRLGPGGTFWLGGHQREGIKAARKALEATVGATVVARTKRHTRVLVATRREEPAEGPDPESLVRRFELAFGGRRISCETLPGAFAHGRLDDGTARLLHWLEEVPTTASVLDLGCGCGVLGVALASRDPKARVELVDAQVAAVASARRTVAANDPGLGERVRVHLADAGDAPHGPFGLVVTNPPFHDGRRENRRLAEGFADAASRRMTPGGMFVVVANRHLGYREALESRFVDVDVPWEDERYRIWRCRRHREET